MEGDAEMGRLIDAASIAKKEKAVRSGCWVVVVKNEGGGVGGGVVGRKDLGERDRTWVTRKCLGSQEGQRHGWIQKLFRSITGSS